MPKRQCERRHIGDGVETSTKHILQSFNGPRARAEGSADLSRGRAAAQPRRTPPSRRTLPRKPNPHRLGPSSGCWRWRGLSAKQNTGPGRVLWASPMGETHPRAPRRPNPRQPRPRRPPGHGRRGRHYAPLCIPPVILHTKVTNQAEGRGGCAVEPDDCTALVQCCQKAAQRRRELVLAREPRPVRRVLGVRQAQRESDADDVPAAEIRRDRRRPA